MSDGYSGPPAVGQGPPADEPGRHQGGHAPAEDNVRPIEQGPADYDLDSREAKRIRPYRLKAAGKWWTVTQPDIGTIMAAEQAPTAEAFMELMFEDQWTELAPSFKAYEDPAAMFEIARAISMHFDLDTATRPKNRRERREAPRRA